MDYVIVPTIPADTSETAPSIESIYLPRGRVKEVAIFFPWGCAGMVHVVIFHNESQVWPTNPEASYIGNDILHEFPEDYELPEAWNYFSVHGWSPDTQEDHEPIIRLTVLQDRMPLWIGKVLSYLTGWRR